MKYCILTILTLFLVFTPAQAESTLQDDVQLFPIMSKAKYGFINQNGKIIIEPQFEDTLKFGNGEMFSEGLHSVKKDDKWGFIDLFGNIVIPFEFTFVKSFSEGLAPVRVTRIEDGIYKSYWGFINKKGEFVVKPKFSDAGQFSEGIAYVVTDGKVSYMNKQGEVIISEVGDSWGEQAIFSEGRAAVSKDRLWGFIDKEGEMIIPQVYKNVSSFKDGLGAVKKENERNTGYINTEGEIVIEPKFTLAWPFSEGLAHVQEGVTHKVINTKGEVQFEFDKEFSWMSPFSEGLAAVKIRNTVDRNRKTGYVNPQGKYLIPPVYESGTSFENGLAYVVSCGREGYINKEGESVWGLRSSKNDEQIIKSAPQAEFLTVNFLKKITSHPGPFKVESILSSGECGPMGKIIWSYQVSGDEKTFNPFTVNLLVGDTFLTKERLENYKAIFSQLDEKLGKSSSFGFKVNENTTGYAIPLGFGPGGSASAISIPTTDGNYELQIIVLIVGEGVQLSYTEETKEYYDKFTKGDDESLMFVLSKEIYNHLFFSNAN